MAAVPIGQPNQRRDAAVQTGSQRHAVHVDGRLRGTHHVALYRILSHHIVAYRIDTLDRWPPAGAHIISHRIVSYRSMSCSYPASMDARRGALARGPAWGPRQESKGNAVPNRV